MKRKWFVKNIIIIIVLLVLVFLSQQSYSNEIGKKLFFQAEAQVKIYWTKVADWFKGNVYPRVSGEVDKKARKLGLAAVRIIAIGVVVILALLLWFVITKKEPPIIEQK